MANFIAAAPPASEGGRSTIDTQNTKASSRVVGYGDDLSVLTENCDYPLPSQATKAATSNLEDDKTAEDEDDNIAIPTPIATLVFQDGRTEPVYKPLAGHEHLFKARPMLSSPASFSNRASSVHRPIQPAPAQVPVTPQVPVLEPQPRPSAKAQKQTASHKQRKPVAHRQGLLKSKSLKRTRSVAQGLASNRKADVTNEDVEEVDEGDIGDQTGQVVTEESHTFYIGDIDAFKEFLRCRFDELTMKPLRGIATHWVKLLEPRRLGDWGKYHEMLPSEADTPPWWPRTVIYKEPSHLKKSELSTLAVEMMLVHRKIDDIKRKGSWITKLRDVAKFTVQTTSADHFSSSKGAAHSEEMKKRALDQILPSIFDVAQAYEDHITQYDLFEGSGNVDPGRGKQHTWKPIPRPARRQLPKRPRRSVADCRAVSRETICEASGDETEPDDTMVRLARLPHGLPQSVPSPHPITAQSQVETQNLQQSTIVDDSHRQTWEVDTPVSVSAPCTPLAPQEDCKMHRTISTPNSSFDQSLHGLHLGEESLDMKSYARTMSDHGNTHAPYNMIPYNQPMQYPAAPTNFSGQVYQHTDSYAHPEPSSFVQNGTSFINPFSMFTAPPPPIGYTQYASPMPAANSFSYDQGVFPPTPMSFPNTPMSMPMTPSDPNMAFHGLPSDYPVDPQRLHQF